MQTAFYAGTSGMIASQYCLDTIGNNLANTNTEGYKSTRASFSNLLFEQMYVGAPSTPIAGVGVRVSSTDLLFQQGTPSQTERALDFSILGDGLFAVEHNGQIQYTRSGAFGLGLDGDTAYLCTSDGSYVLDSNGNRIAPPFDEETGRYDISEVPGQIGIFTFRNVEGLESISGTRFMPTAFSGEAVAINDVEDKPYRLVQFSLERSQTSTVDEMNNMITAQRAFQLSARVVQTADQVEEIVNNLRK